MLVVVNEIFVNFVADDCEVMPDCDCGNFFDEITIPCSASWIGGGVTNHCTGTRRDCGLNLIGMGAVSGFGGGRDDDGFTASENDLIGVCHPERCEKENFIAFVKKDLESVKNRVFSPTGDDDLIFFAIKFVFSSGFSLDCFNEEGKAARWAIFGKSVVKGFLGRFDNWFRRVEIGFASGKGEYVYAFSLHFAGFGGHRKGWRWFDQLATTT